MKRFLLVMGMVIPLAVLAAPFPDTVDHPHQEFIDVLRKHGIVQGYSDGSFQPERSINRAEFLKIVMLSVFGEEALTTGDQRCFSDFVGPDQWYWVYACAAKQRGIIDGYPDGTFRGDRQVNFAEALKISLEAWQAPLPQYIREPDNWYDPYLDAMATEGVYSYFVRNPAHRLTRSEMATIIANLDLPIAQVGPPIVDEEPEPEPEPTPPPPPTGAYTCGNNILEGPEQCDDGNTLDGDGCSSLCIVVPETIRHGALQIDQRPTGQTAEAGGARGVELLAFDAVAGRQDVYLTGLKFRATSGSLANAENYRLYADTDGDGRAESLAARGSQQGTVLAFTTLSALVRDGIYRRFEVRADLRESTTPGVIALAFATTQDRYVEAIDAVDSRDLTGITTDDVECTGQSTCWIRVVTMGAHVVTIAEEGDLFVTKDSVPVSSHQLLGGLRSDVLLRLKFFAQGEDIKVDTLRIGGGSSSVNYLELYRSNESSPFDTARTSECGSGASTTLFCADTSFTIPRNQEVVILVRAFMKADTEGGKSGETVTLTLSAATSSPAVEAHGAVSTRDLAQNDNDTTAEGEIFIGREAPGGNVAITAATNDTVLAKIQNVTNASPDPDDTAVPTGTTPIGAFRFSAAAHSNSNGALNAVELEELVFSINATNVSIAAGSFKLYNKASSSTKLTCSETGTTGNITVTCANIEGNAIGAVISQGSFVELALEANITNARVSGSSSSTLQVSLNQLGDRNLLGTIEWNDESISYEWVDIGTTVVRSTRYRNP